MATFQTYTDSDVDLSVQEMYEQMSEYEKQEMLSLLTDHFSYLSTEYLKSIDQQEYDKALENLKNRYYAINKSDEQTILSISKKY